MINAIYLIGVHIPTISVNSSTIPKVNIMSLQTNMDEPNSGKVEKLK